MADEGAKPRREAAVAKAAAAARAAAKSAPTRPIAPADAEEPPPRTPGRPPVAEPRRPGAFVLDCDHVSQRYPKPTGGWQVVIDDVTLRLPEHDFVSVVGPSGCGKSTMLRMVLGAEAPWQGTVQANGAPVTHPDRRRGIVFQRYSLFPHLTVLDNVVFGLELDGTWLLQKWLTWPWYRRTHHARYVEMAMSYLKTVKLDEHAGKYPHQLSGGMQQRVAIAQAMVMKPSILLMDEPFGALDPGTREALQVFTLETFRQQDISIFFVTHDLEEALFVGNRLVVLSQHYQLDDGAPARGSKVVMDVRAPKGSEVGVKQTAEFQEFIGEVRRRGFDPKCAQKQADFDLRCASEVERSVAADKGP
jgi:NitT/TauT family transport system ATP-binding protein